NMAQRLSTLHFVPSTTSEGIEFNSGTTTAPTTSGAVQQTFTLPSLRTKQDLLDADHFLTQLHANVYENAAHGQPFPFPRGAPAQSPHTPAGPAPQPSPQQSDHEGAAPAAPMAQANSQGGTTQALTPPTSNYTTSQSPATHHATPTTVSPQTS